ncbi:MAG TPA: adenylate/guanylate cyclase domain-containing protein [Sphingopyxis sp.]|nr:adenylate/guanylate cyclase domain-containing protein [Sphingopyxis sp.]HMP46350.1 adenylate/guanylate cyclase domain-containing protein [Sphingopyxis sp.]HMQ20389.1 adenylate/guanylate cyclase domain-containing protein [Sphingopyxis sp.]
MQATTHGKFADPAVEARFHETARRLRLPFVRVYGVLFMLVALAYSIANPLFLHAHDSARVAVLLGAALLLAGAYVAVTFWPRYIEQPALDFAALLGISLLVGLVNLILLDELIELDDDLHAVGTINRLAITAFAAVALAGRPRLFLLWLALECGVFLATVMSIQDHGAGFWYAILSYVSGALVMIAINVAIDRSSRGAFALSEALEAERAKSEELVYNMLPPAAVERIRDGRMVADSYADASVIFIDMVGFTKLAQRVSPGHLVELLNAFFNHADRCAAEHGVEKVKTIGDAYLAIAGGNVASGNSADTAIAFARDVLAGVPELRAVAGTDVGLRVGIHSGPVVGGVIGATRMAYDYWGETVNMAARLEGTAPVNGIAISESSWLRAKDRASFGPPHVEILKGVGETCVYHATPAVPAAEPLPEINWVA